MNAEILSVGTEILLGDILNTNAQYLSQQLAGLGVNVYYQTVVGDNADRLFEALKNAFGRADLVITTGGLGPTDDDLTKETAAKFFDKKMILDDDTLVSITEIFKKFSHDHQMPESNKKQAYIIEDAAVLKNDLGTAPGLLLEEGGKVLIMLPGPPNEAVPMFERHCIPFLKTKQDAMFVSRVLRLSGIGESAAAEKIKHLLDSQDNPTIAPYAKSNEVVFRITARAKNEDDAAALINPVAEEIYGLLGGNIYGEGETTLAECIVRTLAERNLTLAVSESCTGGLVTSALVNVAGASKVLLEGVTTYSNDSKMKRLNVKEETLSKFGAVSAEVAVEMAEGVMKSADSAIGISTTGIAGPDGGTEEKPVGLVYLGMCIGDKVNSKKLTLTGDREKIRNRTVAVLLEWLRTEIKN